MLKFIVSNPEKSIREAAQTAKINYSTAKRIYYSYKKSGDIQKIEKARSLKEFDNLSQIVDRESNGESPEMKSTEGDAMAEQPTNSASFDSGCG